MKKALSIWAATALAGAFLASCKKADVSPFEGDSPTGTIAIEITGEGGFTKAVDTSSGGNEAVVNSVQLLVFNGDGSLERYLDLGATTSVNTEVTVGPKHIWAILNGPDASSILTEGELAELDIALGSYNSTSSDFVMAGTGSCVVNEGQRSECSITASRFVSRISLVKVENQLSAAFGSITLESVWLSNVVGNQKISGTAAHSVWYNRMGRADETPAVAGHIIDGTTYTPSCGDLTFASLSGLQPIAKGASYTGAKRLYCYPNTTANDVTGFSTSFSPRFTRMIVAARIRGALYYYPVVVEQPGRNKAYEVSLTIVGLGSTDPDTPVEKGSIVVTVDVSAWGSGVSINENI